MTTKQASIPVDDHVEDLFEALLDLSFTFDAIHTLEIDATENEHVLKQALRAKCDASVEILISYLRELWVKYSYKTNYNVIDSPYSVGLFHTENVNQGTSLEMKEFIMTTNNETHELWISYAPKYEAVNTFGIKIRSDYIDTIGALAHNCG